MKTAALLIAFATPAFAQTAPDVVQARLLPGWRMDSGHHMAALALDLAPHWKTYWRSPGDAGIPPQFDWSGSQNVKSVRLHWPSPTVFLTNGLQSIGYHDALVLPVEVTALDPAAPVTLALRMDMGVCKDICVPASIAVQATIRGPGAPDAAIGSALRAGPVSGRNAGLRAIGCEVTPIKDGLRLTATMAVPRQGRDEVVVFEPGEPGVWAAPGTVERRAGLLIASTDMNHYEPDGITRVKDRRAIDAILELLLRFFLLFVGLNDLISVDTPATGIHGGWYK